MMLLDLLALILAVCLAALAGFLFAYVFTPVKARTLPDGNVIFRAYLMKAVATCIWFSFFLNLLLADETAVLYSVGAFVAVGGGSWGLVFRKRGAPHRPGPQPGSALKDSLDEIDVDAWCQLFDHLMQLGQLELARTSLDDMRRRVERARVTDDGQVARLERIRSLLDEARRWLDEASSERPPESRSAPQPAGIGPLRMALQEADEACRDNENRPRAPATGGQDTSRLFSARRILRLSPRKRKIRKATGASDRPGQG